MVSNNFNSLFSDATSVIVYDHVNSVVISCMCNSAFRYDLQQIVCQKSTFQQYVIYDGIL